MPQDDLHEENRFFPAPLILPSDPFLRSFLSYDHLSSSIAKIPSLPLISQVATTYYYTRGQPLHPINILCAFIHSSTWMDPAVRIDSLLWFTSFYSSTPFCLFFLTDSKQSICDHQLPGSCRCRGIWSHDQQERRQERDLRRYIFRRSLCIQKLRLFDKSVLNYHNLHLKQHSLTWHGQLFKLQSGSTATSAPDPRAIWKINGLTFFQIYVDLMMCQLLISWDVRGFSLLMVTVMISWKLAPFVTYDEDS